MKACRLAEAQSLVLLKEEEAESIRNAIDRRPGFFKQTLHRLKILSSASMQVCDARALQQALRRREHPF